ncbi:hypothetical protein RclHR1_04200015 [Rhizophagus clarus]|uniref:Uncharacterized protein n=1 Tax=Rhizophagus clarus TaxID=94130 RepID=A0A2Z6SA22_9GLOM|nr:hypothetical protein RclHR1_04200015 [Rhizophagus clarus]GES97359.1 hypothetical protein GLOIN_2v1510815 [Rhizophagus clarus]
MDFDLNVGDDKIAPISTITLQCASPILYMGQYSEYMDEYETYWVKFTALFNNRRKRERRSPTQMYNILSIEIGLSASTLASFYRHQKSPRRTSIDKIIEWVKKEGNKKSVSFSDSNSKWKYRWSRGGNIAK